MSSVTPTTSSKGTIDTTSKELSKSPQKNQSTPSPQTQNNDISFRKAKTGMITSWTIAASAIITAIATTIISVFFVSTLSLVAIFVPAGIALPALISAIIFTVKVYNSKTNLTDEDNKRDKKYNNHNQIPAQEPKQLDINGNLGGINEVNSHESLSPTSNTTGGHKILVDPKAIEQAKIDLEKAEKALQEAKIRLEQAQARLQSAQKNLEQAQIELENAKATLNVAIGVYGHYATLRLIHTRVATIQKSIGDYLEIYSDEDSDKPSLELEQILSNLKEILKKNNEDITTAVEDALCTLEPARDSLEKAEKFSNDTSKLIKALKKVQNEDINLEEENKIDQDVRNKALSVQQEQEKMQPIRIKLEDILYSEKKLETRKNSFEQLQLNTLKNPENKQIIDEILGIFDNIFSEKKVDKKKTSNEEKALKKKALAAIDNLDPIKRYKNQILETFENARKEIWNTLKLIKCNYDEAVKNLKEANHQVEIAKQEVEEATKALEQAKIDLEKAEKEYQEAVDKLKDLQSKLIAKSS